MNLIDHINMYFGTEHESVLAFVKDMQTGDLSNDYSDLEKLNHVLMFLNSVSKNI